MVTRRLESISPSLTLGISARARQMQQQGLEVINFAAGEPDFDTPEAIKEEAIRAIKQGFTKYTPSSGIAELKEAVREKLLKEQGLQYEQEEIIISCGSKHALFNIVFALCEEGDEVIIFAPYWVSYLEMIKLCGARPKKIFLSQENGFQLEVEKLAPLLSSRTRLIILNSPNNPTGAVYGKEELEKLASLLLPFPRLCIISDEIYHKITYDGVKPISIASLGKEIKERTIVVNGVSKTYAMTGWRIGYAAGSREVIQAIGRLQDHTTSNPTSISQRASIAALRISEDEVQKMVEEFSHRRHLMWEGLKLIKGIQCSFPQGAFYFFPRVSNLYGKNYNGRQISDSLDLAAYLLETAKVATVPGIAFGCDEYLRLSYATSRESIEKGLEKMKEVLLR